MNTEESNPVLGIIGAFIGSFLGVLAIVILGQIGYVAVVSGIVMGFGTFMGYSILGQSLDLKGIIISVVIMIIMIYFANRLNWALYFIRAFPDASFSKAFFNIHTIIKKIPDLSSKYYESLVMDYVFCGIGALSYMKRGNGEA